jgi:hypothetical protein
VLPLLDKYGCEASGGVRVFGIVANEINIINNLFHPKCVSELQLTARRCLINDLGVPAREPTNMITKEEGSNLSFSATNQDPDTMLLRLGFLSAANCSACSWQSSWLPSTSCHINVYWVLELKYFIGGTFHSCAQGESKRARIPWLHQSLLQVNLSSCLHVTC